MGSALVLCLAALGAGPCGAEEGPGTALAVEHAGGTIVLHELGPASGLAPRLAPAARAAAAELPPRIGLALPPRVDVVICGDAQTFARYAGAARTQWLLGVALPGRALAALNAPLLAPGPERGPVGVLRHELVHLALGTVPPAAAPLPVWFEEGVASWFAGGMTELGPLDLAGATAAPELGLKRLAYGFPSEPAARSIAYAKSQLAIELLERRPGTVAAIGVALANGVPFANALAASAGRNEKELEAEWRRAAAPHGLLIAVLKRSLSPALLMAGLVVLGFLLRRRRLRRRLKAWAEEEANAPPEEHDRRGWP